MWTSPGGYWDEALAESQYPDESTNRFVRVKNNIFLYTEVNFLILLKYNFILVENRVACYSCEKFVYVQADHC